MQLLTIPFMRAIFASIVFIPLLVSGQTIRPNRIVRFSITDCWGGPIPSARVYLASIGPQTSQEGIEYPTENSFSLKPGQYHARIESTGFFSSSELIQLSDTDLYLHNCLTLAPIEGTQRPVVRVEGTVARTLRKNGSLQWVRLIGLYSDANSTAAVDEKGHFILSDNRPGQYLLIVLEKSGIKATKEVSVSEPSTTILVP